MGFSNFYRPVWWVMLDTTATMISTTPDHAMPLPFLPLHLESMSCEFLRIFLGGFKQTFTAPVLRAEARTSNGGKCHALPITGDPKHGKIRLCSLLPWSPAESGRNGRIVKGAQQRHTVFSIWDKTALCQF